jgi:hypothetical protein
MQTAGRKRNRQTLPPVPKAKQGATNKRWMLRKFTTAAAVMKILLHPAAIYAHSGFEMIFS